MKIKKLKIKNLYLGLAPATALNVKDLEIENKIHDITNLAAKASLNRKATKTENKIPDTSHFF